MKGTNLVAINKVKNILSIPVVAAGGIFTMEHASEAIKSGAHSVSAGNMFVYQGNRKAVLINYPSEKVIRKLFDV
ncbi:nitronate monooxygenase [Nitrincola sp. A-D6]|uniref:nitronate monooxygenase n=1 Tax=Nitrincola sp. A-D6 TaxID=1545442 RepID=UPI000691295B|nr:nitronate monooxygenase [Nitrincola sp. A-D6]